MRRDGGRPGPGGVSGDDLPGRRAASGASRGRETARRTRARLSAGRRAKDVGRGGRWRSARPRRVVPLSLEGRERARRTWARRGRGRGRPRDYRRRTSVAARTRARRASAESPRRVVLSGLESCVTARRTRARTRARPSVGRRAEGVGRGGRWRGAVAAEAGAARVRRVVLSGLEGRVTARRTRARTSARPSKGRRAEDVGRGGRWHGARPWSVRGGSCRRASRAARRRGGAARTRARPSAGRWAEDVARGGHGRGRASAAGGPAGR